MDLELRCPFCKQSVILTPFGLFSKHRGKGKKLCCGSGYTPNEASRIVNAHHA